MEKKKMSLEAIKNVLTRKEMKKIMAGSGGQCGSQKCGTYPCVDAQGYCSNCCVAA